MDYEMALVYNGLGDREMTFEHLERAYGKKEEGMRNLIVFPCWDNLRSDPRYKSLMQRMNLE